MKEHKNYSICDQINKTTIKLKCSFDYKKMCCIFLSTSSENHYSKYAVQTHCFMSFGLVSHRCGLFGQLPVNSIFDENHVKNFSCYCQFE